VTIHSGTPGDLSALRIDRDAAPRRPWLAWAIVAVLCAAAVTLYPRGRAYVAEQRAPEVETARATQVITAAGASTEAYDRAVAAHGPPEGDRSGHREPGARGGVG